MLNYKFVLLLINLFLQADIYGEITIARDINQLGHCDNVGAPNNENKDNNSCDDDGVSKANLINLFNPCEKGEVIMTNKSDLSSYCDIGGVSKGNKIIGSESDSDKLIETNVDKLSGSCNDSGMIKAKKIDLSDPCEKGGVLNADGINQYDQDCLLVECEMIQVRLNAII